MLKEVVVVGSGLSGSVIARELAEAGYLVTVLEKRNHTGGNMYDCVDKDTGILFHKYGPHTFHTKDKRLYDYFTRYIDVEPFYLKCTSIIRGKEFPCPFNFEIIDSFYSREKVGLLKQKLLNIYGEETTILELLQSKDKDVKEYGEFLFKQDYKPYTTKQWGLNPKMIDYNILKRVPIYFNYNENYFTDEYQCIPKTTYNDFFRNILNHKNIKVFTNTDGLDKISFIQDKILYDGKEVILVYTGMIDRLFNYRFGVLPYRTLKFKIYRYNTPSFQRGVVCATPSLNYKGTRRVEYSKMPVQKNNKTLLVYEYSSQYRPDSNDEAYYPVINLDSVILYNKYVELSKQYKNLFVCGRLGLFKYLNMDQTIKESLSISDIILNC